MAFVLTWTGADGSVWPLHRHPVPAPGGGRVYIAPGVQGLGKNGWKEYVSEPAGGHGQRFRGAVGKARKIVVPVAIHGATWAEWKATDRALDAALSTLDAGTLTVTDTETGESRRISARYTGGMDPELSRPPGSDNFSQYTIEWTADEPWWRGDPIVSPDWGNAEIGTDFTGPLDKAPDFYISAGSSAGSAQIHNPGRIPAWPRFDVVGPVTAVTLTVDGWSVTAPIVLTAGQTMSIDYGIPIARLGDGGDGGLGTDVTTQLTEADFAPVPARGTAKIGVQISGTGTVRATIIPLHERSW